MPDYNTIKTEISDGIFTLTLHRPDRMNAFTSEMMQEMVAAFDVADADDAVRAPFARALILAQAAIPLITRNVPTGWSTDRRFAKTAVLTCHMKACAIAAGG